MPIVLSGLAVILLGFLTLQGWALLHVRAQGERVQQRLDTLGHHAKAGTPAPSRPALAPPFNLQSLTGGRVSLASLLAPAKPVLLFFTDPRCGPCFELLPDLGGWERVYGDRLTIAVISGGDLAQNRAMTGEYGLKTVLVQEEREVAEAYAVQMAPAAAIVLPNGQLSDDLVYGAIRIRNLVAQTLGLSMPEAPIREIAPVTVGQPAPKFRQPDLDGNVINLPMIGRPTLLLFWSPGCHHCQELLPEIKEWEEQRGRLSFVVVSSGPIALNKEAGLSSPIILDEDRTIAQSFGTSGTPAAVVIDERGIVVSQVARGASGVRALANRLLEVVRAAA